MDRQIKKKSWFRKNYIAVILSTSFLILILITLVFQDHSSKIKVEKDKITMAKVKKDTFKDYISIVGVTEPIRTVSLNPKVGGQVKEKLKEEGDQVNAGDVILKLSNPELEQSIIDLKAELEQERINVQQSKITEEKNWAGFKGKINDMNFSINTELRTFEEKKYEYKKGMIPKNTFLMAQESLNHTLEKKEMLIEDQKRDSLLSVLNIKRLENNLKRNEAKFQIEKRKLDDLYVKAPVAGRLSSLINVEIGGQIGRNAGIGYIRDLSNLKIISKIDEHYSRRVTQKLSGSCKIGDNLFDLFVDKVSLEVIEGKFETELLFADKMPDMIRFGQTYQIKLQLGKSKLGILIPRGGFFQSTGGQWIFVVDESGEIARKRDISIGRQNSEYYEVIEGLDPGEEVIISSYDIYGDAEVLILK